MHHHEISNGSTLPSPTLQEITRLQEAEAEAVGSKQQLQLVIDLPVFPHAVLYQQASSPASVLTQPTTTTTKKEVLSPVGSDSSGSDDIILLHDPEVRRVPGWYQPPGVAGCWRGGVSWLIAHDGLQ